MLFAPNDFNSSSVVSISGICHSMPHVWQETVTPLKYGCGAGGSAGDSLAGPATNSTQRAKTKGGSDDFILTVRSLATNELSTKQSYRPGWDFGSENPQSNGNPGSPLCEPWPSLIGARRKPRC